MGNVGNEGCRAGQEADLRTKIPTYTTQGTERRWAGDPLLVSFHSPSPHHLLGTCSMKHVLHPRFSCHNSYPFARGASTNELNFLWLVQVPSCFPPSFPKCMCHVVISLRATMVVSLRFCSPHGTEGVEIPALAEEDRLRGVVPR